MGISEADSALSARPIANAPHRQGIIRIWWPRTESNRAEGGKSLGAIHRH
jgi:hypothetical protein